MLYIKKINGRYYLTTAEGYTLHSESTIEKMMDYCKEQFAATYTKGMIFFEGRAIK